MSAILIFAFISTFGLTGCSVIEDYAGTPPWQDTDDPTNPGGDVNPTGWPTKGMCFFHPDYTGNISYVTDKVGKVISRLRYKPYGEVQEIAGSDVYRYKYNTQENDGNELLYYGARYYDPIIGRFISADSIIPNITNTQAFNPYMFVIGNPIRYADNDGHNWFTGLWHKFVDKVAKPVGNFLNQNIAQPTQGGMKDAGNWWKKQWNDWGKYVAPFVLIAAAAVLGILTGPPGWIVLGTTIAGMLIGGTEGKILTDPVAVLKGDFHWNWDYAAAGAAIGFAVGVVGQYGLPLLGNAINTEMSFHLFELSLTVGQVAWYSGWGYLAYDWAKVEQGGEKSKYPSRRSLIKIIFDPGWLTGVLNKSILW